jgi:HK97 gp10 family phage protein
MAIFSTEIEGLDELVKQVAKLGDDAMPFLKESADEAGNLLLKRMKNTTMFKDQTGTARKSLVLRKQLVKPKKYILFDSVTYKGTTKGSTVPGGHHIPLLEFGHKLVRGGKVVGQVDKRPFMRDAADDSKNEVTDIITKYLNQALDNAGR